MSSKNRGANRTPAVGKRVNGGIHIFAVCVSRKVVPKRFSRRFFICAEYRHFRTLFSVRSWSRGGGDDGDRAVVPPGHNLG
jgi:hypothetical protein